MDSITHIVTGACIGEAMLGRKIGRKAMLWGALAQSLPDIDFVAGLWMDLPRELLAHRGFTHSFLFAGMMTVLLALTAERIHRPHDISLKRFLRFFLIEIGVHLFLDAFNNYGVGWFEPFSDHRISFHTVYVADPFFTFVPIIAFLRLLQKRGTFVVRRQWAMAGIIAPVVYLTYAVTNKLTIELKVRSMAEKQGITHTRYFTTPAPLNSWLWFVVMEQRDGFQIGYRSVFDGKQPLNLRFFPRYDSLLKPIWDHEEVMQLKKFSQGYYTVEQHGDTLVFNDLRFGQMIGWKRPEAGFVFHYHLTHPEDNELVVQRGRFAGWSMQTPMDMWQRIRGISLPESRDQSR
jgi:inner membrane protein